MNFSCLCNLSSTQSVRALIAFT